MKTKQIYCEKIEQRTNLKACIFKIFKDSACYAGWSILISVLFCVCAEHGWLPNSPQQQVTYNQFKNVVIFLLILVPLITTFRAILGKYHITETVITYTDIPPTEDATAYVNKKETETHE